MSYRRDITATAAHRAAEPRGIGPGGPARTPCPPFDGIPRSFPERNTSRGVQFYTGCSSHSGVHALAVKPPNQRCCLLAAACLGAFVEQPLGAAVVRSMLVVLIVEDEAAVLLLANPCCRRLATKQFPPAPWAKPSRSLRTPIRRSTCCSPILVCRTGLKAAWRLVGPSQLACRLAHRLHHRMRRHGRHGEAVR